MLLWAWSGDKERRASGAAVSGGETGARIETYFMFLTLLTFHCERSEENDVAWRNMLLREWSERQRAPGVRCCGERRRDGRTSRRTACP